MPGRLLPYGDRAVLLEVEDLDEALALHDVLTSVEQAGQMGEAGSAGEGDGNGEGAAPSIEVVVGARTVLLVAASPAELATVRTVAHQALTALPEVLARTADRTGHPPDRVVEVPVHYDGPDLREVAALTGLSTTEVVAAHTGTPWRVGFAGFAPGFAYLVDGDPRLRVPRRSSPRARVPAGAVGLADGFSGIYPRSSPGGWQLLGRTDLALWDLEQDPPALLRPGLWVRFTDAGGER